MFATLAMAVEVFFIVVAVEITKRNTHVQQQQRRVTNKRGSIFIKVGLETLV